jgi:hypothetical protein
MHQETQSVPVEIRIRVGFRVVVLGNWREVWCPVDASGMVGGYTCIGLWLQGTGEREEEKMAGVLR